MCHKFSHDSSVTFVDCVTAVFRGEEGKGEGSSQGAVSVQCQLAAAKYSLYCRSLNINLTRMDDLIVRIMVILL